jgi:RNA polymerase sigma factor (sigma-70 family)
MKHDDIDRQVLERIKEESEKIQTLWQTYHDAKISKQSDITIAVAFNNLNQVFREYGKGFIHRENNLDTQERQDLINNLNFEIGGILHRYEHKDGTPLTAFAETRFKGMITDYYRDLNKSQYGAVREDGKRYGDIVSVRRAQQSEQLSSKEIASIIVSTPELNEKPHWQDRNSQLFPLDKMTQQVEKTLTIFSQPISSTEISDDGTYTDITELLSRLEDPTPEENYERQNAIEILYGAIGQLSEKQQKYLRMSLQGISTTEVLELEDDGVSRNKIDCSLNQARLRLKKILKDYPANLLEAQQNKIATCALDLSA